MYYVYFARGYANEEMIAECRTLEAAKLRADEEYDMGSRDVEVYNNKGEMLYEPREPLLFDEH
jgi:hypothetical protein